MQRVIHFLTGLADHTCKEWFDAHKDDYLQVQQLCHDLATQLIDGISRFDPSVRGLTVRDVTYRIYRDLRFSNDKTPYKTHIGIYVCPGGKKSLKAGYYFHIEPGATGGQPKSMLCSGLYCPTPALLKSVREEIEFNGTAYTDAIEQADGFSLEHENPLKRVPQGFPADSPRAPYLMLRHHLISRPVDNEWITQKDLASRTVREFEKTRPFVVLLNKAVDYALD